MYIVTIDRPYYPSVQYFATEEEARVEYQRIIREENDDDGKHCVRATISMVVELMQIKTHF